VASHPGSNELTSLAGVNFKLLGSATAKSTHNRQVFPPKEGVKRVINGHFAQIAGISLGRAKAKPSLSTRMPTTWMCAGDLRYFSRFAMQSSTHIRKGLSTAT
jgi:hypothetical protein